MDCQTKGNNAISRAIDLTFDEYAKSLPGVRIPPYDVFERVRYHTNNLLERPGYTAIPELVIRDSITKKVEAGILEWKKGLEPGIRRIKDIPPGPMPPICWVCLQWHPILQSASQEPTCPSPHG